MTDDRPNKVRYYAEGGVKHYDAALDLRRRADYYSGTPADSFTGAARNDPGALRAAASLEATLSVAAFLAAADLRAQLAEESADGH